jgi:hypothetical protein
METNSRHLKRVTLDGHYSHEQADTFKNTGGVIRRLRALITDHIFKKT